MNRREEAPHLPTQLYIEPTNRCNSKCNICVRTFYQYEKTKDLSFDEFKLIVDQFPNLKRVVLHGIGEPLLNADISEMVSYLKARNAYVLFNSNATLLDPEIQKGLIDAGLDEYRVSIDSATPETYLKVRGVPLFDRVIDNLKGFVALQKSLQKQSPKISLWFVGEKENIAELPDLIRLAKDIGIKEVYLQRLTYFDGQKARGLAKEELTIYQNPGEKVMQIIEECESLAHDLKIAFRSSGATTPKQSLIKRGKDEYPWQSCLRPWTLSYITANGNALPCCISPFSVEEYADLILGNVFEDKFGKIWNGKKYRSLRRRLLGPNPPQYCRGCGVKWSL
ncbi:MAG: radical SAM/SPASM domain-containing protein [Candidatus Hydrothermarchaeales archaeon]